MVINVYMPYFKCEISDNTTEYELNVEIIYGLICKYKKENKEIIICGDFNTDFCKHKTYSKLLLKMIGAAEMCSIDVLNKQNTEFTYIKKYQSLIITSWIDHIFVLNNCSQKVKYVKILGKLANNVSDHLPISLLYKLEINYSQKTIINDDDIKIKEFNWLNPFLRDYYFREINKNGTNINSKLQKL